MSQEDLQQQKGKTSLHDLKKALLVGVYPSGKSDLESREFLDELRELGKTYGFEQIEEIFCPIKEFNASTYIGKGKVEEIKGLCEQRALDVVIFDDEITPNQQKNIEKVVNKPVIDRTELILEIFSDRAQTKEARLQIELAKLKYQLPRLKRMWTHLSRQRTGGSGSGGGGGYLRGSGEKQIEVDRRIIKERVSTLERELKAVRNQRNLERKSRLRKEVPTFSIVGYTNAGKSTLLNALTEANILAEDKLFATLDTTTRHFILPNHQKILLIDTVGFIRKLPHLLVAAFKSTLEEAVYTDILLHIVDVSHPKAVEQAKTTVTVLKELGVKDIPMITVLNKIDRCEDQQNVQKLRLSFPNTVVISALKKEGFEDLLKKLMEHLQSLRKLYHLRIPQSEYAVAGKLMKEGNVLSSDYEGNDILLTVEVPNVMEHEIRDFIDHRGE